MQTMVLMEEVDGYKKKLKCPICNIEEKDAILTKCFHVFCYKCLKTRYETRFYLSFCELNSYLLFFTDNENAQSAIKISVAMIITRFTSNRAEEKEEFRKNRKTHTKTLLMPFLITPYFLPFYFLSHSLVPQKPHFEHVTQKSSRTLTKIDVDKIEFHFQFYTFLRAKK